MSSEALNQACILPKLEGMEQSAAEEAISQLGLRAVKSNEYSVEVPRGRVSSQNPPSGKKLNPCQGDVVIVTSLGAMPSPAPTLTYVNFSEEFDTTELDKSVWDQVGQLANLSNSMLVLKGEGTVTPLVYTKQDIFPPSNNYQIEIAFRYTQLGYWSQIIAVSKNVPSQGHLINDDDSQNALLFIYQDNRDVPLTIFLLGTVIYQSIDKDMSMHNVLLVYDGKYTLFLDGTLIHTSSPTNYRPSTIWFGEPRIEQGTWSTLEIDYVRVKTAP